MSTKLPKEILEPELIPITLSPHVGYDVETAKRRSRSQIQSLSESPYERRLRAGFRLLHSSYE